MTDLEILLGTLAACSLVTSVASTILAFRANDILRASDAVADLIAEQTRLLRNAALRDRAITAPPARRSGAVIR